MRTIGNVWGAAHQLHCLPGALPSMEWHQQANYHLQVALWLCKWGNTAWNRTSTPYDCGYHLCHCGPQTSLSAVKLLLGPGVFSQWLNEPRPPMVWFLWPGDRNGKYHAILKPGTCFGTTVTTLVGMAKNNRFDPSQLPSSIHGSQTHRFALQIHGLKTRAMTKDILWKHLKLCSTQLSLSQKKG